MEENRINNLKSIIENLKKQVGEISGKETKEILNRRIQELEEELKELLEQEKEDKDPEEKKDQIKELQTTIEGLKKEVERQPEGNYKDVLKYNIQRYEEELKGLLEDKSNKEPEKEQNNEVSSRENTEKEIQRLEKLKEEAIERNEDASFIETLQYRIDAYKRDLDKGLEEDKKKDSNETKVEASVIDENDVEGRSIILKKRIQELEEQLKNKGKELEGSEKISQATEYEATMRYELEKCKKELAKLEKDKFQPPTVAKTIQKDSIEEKKSDVEKWKEGLEGGFQPPAVVMPKVVINGKSGMYRLIDKQGNVIVEMKMDPKLLKGKKAEQFRDELANKYRKAFAKQEDIDKTKEFMDKIDLNLYKLYEKYDKMLKKGDNEKNCCNSYIMAADMQSSEMLLTEGKILYDFVSKDEKSEKIGLFEKMKNILNTHRHKKIAKEQKKMGLADVKDNFKSRLGGLIFGATAFGIIGSGAVEYGSNLIKNSPTLNNENKTESQLPENEMKTTQAVVNEALKRKGFKDNIHVDVDPTESIENQKREIEESIAIGDSAILEDFQYYGDSEGGGNTANTKDRKDKDCEILHIAAVDKETGKYIESFDDKGMTIAEVQAKYPDAIIKISVGGHNDKMQYGWGAYTNEVKDKFVEAKMMNQVKETVSMGREMGE